MRERGGGWDSPGPCEDELILPRWSSVFQQCQEDSGDTVGAQGGNEEGDAGPLFTLQTLTEHALRARGFHVCQVETGVTERWPVPRRDRGDGGHSQVTLHGRLLVPKPRWGATCSRFPPASSPLCGEQGL